MRHLTEEELILHYYGEEGDTLATEHHLDGCVECRALNASLQRVLNVVDSLPVPERGAAYESVLWTRIATQLPRSRWSAAAAVPAWRWAMAAAAGIVLVCAAFFAGRSYPRLAVPKPEISAVHTDIRERVLLVAVGDYLDRSQTVLVELANANPRGPLDISSEQERADDLIGDTRLLRQTAASTGDASLTALLDELERVLLDVARGPSRLSPAQLDRIRNTLKAQGIIFKIRVVNSQLRSRQEAAPSNTARQTL
jgi:hypothetical protein